MAEDVKGLEAAAAAAELGVPLDDRPGFVALVQDMLSDDSLPEGWSVKYDTASGKRQYTHAPSGTSSDAHPLLDYYRGAAFMEAGGYKQLLAAEAKAPPSDDEVAEMCEYLGVMPGEDPYLVEVAAMAINAPLPDGWEEVDGDDGTTLFKHAASGTTSTAHPLDMYFGELLARRRAEVSDRGAAVTIKSAMSQRRLASLSMSARRAAEGRMPPLPPPQPSAPADGEQGIPEDIPTEAPELPANEVTEEERLARMAAARGSGSGAGAPGQQGGTPPRSEGSELGALGMLPLGRRAGTLPPIGEDVEARGSVGAALPTQTAADEGTSNTGSIAANGTAPVALDAVRRLSLQRQTSRNRKGSSQDGSGGEGGARTSSHEAASPGPGSAAVPMHQLYPPPSAPAPEGALHSSQSSTRRGKHKGLNDSLTSPPDKARWGLDTESVTGGSRKGIHPDAKPLPPPPPSYWEGPLTIKEAAQREAWEAQQAAARTELELMQEQLRQAQGERATREAQYSAQQQSQAQPALLPLAPTQQAQQRAQVLTPPVGREHALGMQDGVGGGLPQEAPAWQQQSYQPQEYYQDTQPLMGPTGGDDAAVQGEAGSQAAQWAAWHEQQEQELAQQQAAWDAQQEAMAQAAASQPPDAWQPPAGSGWDMSGHRGANGPPALGPAGAPGVWTIPEEDAAMEAQKNELALMAALAAEGDGIARQPPAGMAAQQQPDTETAARASRERIRVAVRARPLTNPREEVSAFIIDPVEHTVRLKDNLAGVYRGAGGPGRVFQYDLVLGPQTTTDALFGAHVRPLVDGALRGFNATVFAYGQTGSGKTHTIFGDQSLGPAGLRSGTLGLSLAHLFGAIEMAGMPPSTAASFAIRDSNTGAPGGPVGALGLPISAHAGAPPNSHQRPSLSSQASMNYGRGSGEAHTIKLSMLELYNEQLRDLLAPGAPGANGSGGGAAPGYGQAPLQLVDDARVGIRVQGLSEVVVPGFSRALSLVEAGNGVRAVGATKLNEYSSRSHTIVRVLVETRGPPPPPAAAAAGLATLSGVGQAGGAPAEGPLLRTALLHWVDLAGSERLAKTGSTGVRFNEGTSINLSLLMLGSVIARLAESAARAPGKASSDAFIPYRNSKLTRLLQPCLGGNARTAIVATINPSHRHVDETLNTLLFAQRAMAVVNSVQVNKVTASMKGANTALVSELRAQVSSLQAQLRAATAQVAALPPGASPRGGISAPAAPLPDLNTTQMAQLAARLNALESDKAVLLDRLEGVTGQPQGGVWDELPPTPPGLKLPSERPGRRVAGGVSRITPEVALRSIARIAALGRAPDGVGTAARIAALAGPKSSAAASAAGDAPEVVVSSVRRLRAERDELRRRDSKLRASLSSAREQLKALQPFAEAREAVEDCVVMLEDIVGPAGLGPKAGRGSMEEEQEKEGGEVAGELVGRLREGVEAVVMLASELSVMQRQLHTAHALQAAAEARAAEVEELWRATNARQSEGMGHAGSPHPQQQAVGAAAGDGGGHHDQGQDPPPDGPDMQQKHANEHAAVDADAQPAPPPPPPPAEKPGLFAGLFGRKHVAEVPPTIASPAPAPASANAAPARGKSANAATAAAKQQSAAALACQVEELHQLIKDQEVQMAALRQQLVITQEELNHWRGFTDMQEVMGGNGTVAATQYNEDGALMSPQGGSPGAGAPGVVVVGSMAVRAAREARMRAAQAEANLVAVCGERDALMDKLRGLEVATGIQGLAGDGEGGEGGMQQGGEYRHEYYGDGDGRPALAPGVERANALKAHVVSLSREVAALTRERDSLLGLVLQAAAAAQQAPGAPQVMPADLVSSVFLTNAQGGIGDQGLSLEALLAPPLMAPAPAGRKRGAGGPQRSRSRSPGGSRVESAYGSPPPPPGGGRRRPAGGAGGRRGKNAKKAASASGLPEPRPAFDAKPMPVEAFKKLQKQEDRMVLRGELSPVRGALSDSPLMGGGQVGSIRDADLLGLRRKLVAAEKARREAELKAAQEARAAEQAVAVVTRQAAAAGKAHADAIAEVRAEGEEAMSRVKADAAKAITALMTENARLKQLVQPGGLQASLLGMPMPPVLAPGGRRGASID